MNNGDQIHFVATQGANTSAIVNLGSATGTIRVRPWTFWGGYQLPADFRYTR